MRTRNSYKNQEKLWRELGGKPSNEKVKNKTVAAKPHVQVFTVQNLSTKFDNDNQANTAFGLALGRILRIGSRPFQQGDIEQYETCKSIIMDVADYFGITS